MFAVVLMVRGCVLCNELTDQC